MDICSHKQKDTMSQTRIDAHINRKIIHHRHRCSYLHTTHQKQQKPPVQQQNFSSSKKFLQFCIHLSLIICIPARGIAHGEISHGINKACFDYLQKDNAGCISKLLGTIIHQLKYSIYQLSYIKGGCILKSTICFEMVKLLSLQRNEQ